MDSDFQKMMEELKIEYLNALPEKIKRLNHLITQKDKEALENEFHKLKGTGKTYGFPEVSEICAKAEEACMGTSENWLAICSEAMEKLSKI